jgi:signal transduction histidine kinase
LRKRLTLWVTFVLIVFFILFTTIVIAIILNILIVKLGLAETRERTAHKTFELILLTSGIFGTILSAIAGKRFLKPIYELRDATKKIATGDFKVRVNDCKILELNALIHDFNNMVKDLGSIETLKNDFITNVSHEIKTPIASIEGCVELLKEQTLTEEEVQEYINLIDISVKRLSVMTSNILRLSKLENQEILPDQKEFSLDEQIRQAVLLLERQWSAKNINLNIHLQSVRFFANKDLLMQVWVNLIDNAIKFSEDGGTVAIELFHTDDRAYVKVIDYGIGMAEETAKYIFQKFYQGNAARSDQGNGLGLALAKRIVELNNGDISVESRPGKGSTFTVDLPLPKKMP